MLKRVFMRGLAANVLGATNIVAPSSILIHPDWPTMSPVYPALLVYTRSERKESKLRGPPEYDTTLPLTIGIRFEGDSAPAALAGAEALEETVEAALLSSQPFMTQLQQVAFIDKSIEVTSGGKKHLAEITLDLGLEYFEAFEWNCTGTNGLGYFPIPESPPAILSGPVINLLQVNVTLDSINVFDPTGTYPPGEFASSVTPAPRTQGPDGRAEGTLQITLPQQ
jgi:hypothetical protein